MGKICIPIVEATMGDAIKKASRWADLIELRVDYLGRVELAPPLENRLKPIIITIRRKEEEEGKYKGEERKRLSVLQNAIDPGADYIDVELATETSFLKDLIRNKSRPQVILSFHDFRRIPPLKELQKLFDQMIQLGADVIKIVPLAKSWEDNLTIQSRLPNAMAQAVADLLPGMLATPCNVDFLTANFMSLVFNRTVEEFAH